MEVTRTVTADVLNVSVQAKPLRSVILSRMEEDEQEIYEEVYSNRGNLQTYKTPVELNWVCLYQYLLWVFCKQWNRADTTSQRCDD